MSNLYITEFDQLVITDNGVPWFGKFDADTVQQTPIAIGGTSEPSQPFAMTTKFVRVIADATCSIAYTPPGQATEAATANGMLLYAGVPEYFGVDPKGVLSVISNS